LPAGLDGDPIYTDGRIASPPASPFKMDFIDDRLFEISSLACPRFGVIRNEQASSASYIKTAHFPDLHAVVRRISGVQSSAVLSENLDQLGRRLLTNL